MPSLDKQVILDTFVTGDFFSLDTGAEFDGSIEIEFLRDGNPITTGNEQIYNAISTDQFPQITANSSVMWGNTPSLGTYHYRLSISTSRTNTDDTRNTLGPRAIRAIIVNTL